MSRFTLQLLGTVRVESDKDNVPRFRSQRTMALLGYLVAEQRAISRDFLAVLFWPDEELSKGKANLRRELHNLAQILPGCWRVSRQDVAFVVGAERPALDLLAGTRQAAAEVAVDIYQFQQYEAAQKWQEAADLIGGIFLEGIVLADNLEFETWLLGEQERWRHKAEAVLTRVIEMQIRQAAYTAALGSARRLLRLTPWNEAVHRQVMLLLVRTGQRSAALKQYTICQAILQAELGMTISSETTVLYERIKWKASFVPHNLPALTTPFIGREEELSLLTGWLDNPQTRLITITGLGGIGKTRLALAAAQHLLDPSSPQLGYPANFPDGLFFVSLAPLHSSSQIVPAIAQVLEIHFLAQGDPLVQLQNHLADKQLLFILDNFEHILDGETIVARLLQSAPMVFIIVTSRERLKLHQAQVLAIKGLSYPEIGQTNFNSYAAVQLFLHTAQRSKYDFSLREGDEENLIRACQLLEGMPLGIELAAIWSHTLSLSDTVSELEHGLDLLQTEAVDLPERHRSVRTAFDVTWRYLSPAERNLFTKLSVFRGGFTQRSAGQIAQATLPMLTLLVSKSLLHYSQTERRYDLHELLRQYGAEKLAQSVLVEDEVRVAHSRYYCDFLHKQEQAIFGSDVAKTIKVIESDLDNVRLAWRTAARRGQFESLRKALVVLMEFYGVSGRVTEGFEVISFATQQVKIRLATLPLKTPTDQCLWADMLFYCGLHSFLVAKFEQAGAYYQACLQILRQPDLVKLDTRDREARALRWLGQLVANTNPTQAKVVYEESLALYRAIGDQPNVSGVSNLLAIILRDLGDIHGGYRLLLESLTVSVAEGDQRTQIYTLELLGLFQLRLGYLAEAEDSHRQCLALCQKMNFQSMVNSILTGLGVTLIWNGKFAEGCSYLLQRISKLFDKGHDSLAILHNGLSMAYLHQGQYDQAKSHCELSLSAARKSKIPRYIATALWVKGQISLIQDDLQTTKQILNESLSVIEGVDLIGCHELPLVGLAFNAFRCRNLQIMRDYLMRSLRIAVDTESFLSLLDIFPAVALYLLGQNELSLALETYTLASQYAYVANSRWFDDIVGWNIKAIKAGKTAKGKRCGEGRDMWVTATELLMKLERDASNDLTYAPS